MAATAAYGVDYYVDANYGNDGWDGTTAAIPDAATIEAGGTIAGPRKTLHAMMSDTRVVAGDTVWAAEGDYNEGGDVNGTELTTNRVQVKGGVMLCARGTRDATFISGADGIDGAYSNGAVRCVFFLPPENSSDGYGIVKGFTVRNGRTCNTDEYGGASTGDGLMVECDFQNNGCLKSGRAGSMNKGYAMRCKFTSTDSGYHAYNGTWVVNSLIVAGGLYSNCMMVNCTFLGSSCPRNSSTYNCLFIGTGTSSSIQTTGGTSRSKHYHTYSRSEFRTDYCTPDEACRVVSEAETPYDETTFRPLAGSLAIDAGDPSYYKDATNKWVAAWLAEADKDYYGNARCVNGAIDVGCGEKQPVEGSPLAIVDELDGLVVVGAEKGESQLEIGEDYPITLSRTLTSDRLCLGVMVNGVFHSFGGTTSNVSCSVTLQGRQGQDSRIAAVYETDQKDWYVSPTGNNANKGYHQSCPRRTLDKAMELATANASHIVHAAAGIYDSFADGEEYASASSRVVVKEGVGLVADDWPLLETVIKGASDTTSEDRDQYGNGPKAVRCVTVNQNGYVRGFKLTDGRTSLTNYAGTGAAGGACGGGAILYAPAALVDCEISGNGAHYRGSVAAGVEGASGCFGWLIRCYAHDNDAHGGSYQLFDRMSVVDSYVDANGTSPYYCRGSAIILNSTLVGGGTRSWNTLYAYNSYFSSVSHGSGTHKFYLYNCAFTTARNKSGVDSNANMVPNEVCLFSVVLADNLDANYRPKTTVSPLVDAGVKDYYDTKFPTQFAQFKDCDFARGQRIYNGQIDIGCGECDFRGDFAALLGPRAVIPEMGPNVTTNAVPNIVVPEGESITVLMAPRASSRETRYELAYTPEGGSPTVISEKSAEPFLYTLGGACTVQSLDGFMGFMFLIR